MNNCCFFHYKRNILRIFELFTLNHLKMYRIPIDFYIEAMNENYFGSLKNEK